MALSPHQLKHPSHNVPLAEPDGSPSMAWTESTLDEVARVLGLTKAQADKEFPDVVRLAMIESICGWGPKDSGEEVLWMFGKQIRNAWRMRPGSGYEKEIDPETHEELVNEQGHPHQCDAVGMARQLGKEAKLADALAAARAVTTMDTAAKHRIHDGKGNPAPASPKAARLVAKDRMQTLLDEISGAAEANRRRGPVKPVSPPPGP